MPDKPLWHNHDGYDLRHTHYGSVEPHSVHSLPLHDTVYDWRKHAIHAVALRIMTTMAADIVPQWENWPEIGEQDRQDILKYIRASLTGDWGDDQFNAAYAALAAAARAENASQSQGGHR